MPRHDDIARHPDAYVAHPSTYLLHPGGGGGGSVHQMQQQLQPSHHHQQQSQLHGTLVTAQLHAAADNNNNTPWVEILEQPKQRGLRFRYKCEGRSAGSILGELSTNEHKSFPKIRVNNFDSSVAIIVVSCVSHEPPYTPHPHSLVGTDCKDGVCTVKIKGINTITFTNIGIQCCKRQEVPQSLKVRENMRVNPFGSPPPADLSKIDLSSVRLCFQAFLPDSNGKFTRIVTPVVSHPIIDKKSVRDLVICRLSRQSGYASGGDEVFLLCEKINKDDIQVRFYEETEDGIAWEAFGEFTPQDVHHQYAIVFQTPPYKDSQITSSAQVYIQLRRPSDDDVSDPKPFQYIPVDPDPYLIQSKRKRLASEAFDDPSAGPITYNIPSSVLPLAVKDDFDELASSDQSNASQNLRQNLKNKVERRMSKKDKMLASIPASVPRYSFDATPTDGATFMTSLAAATGHAPGSQLVLCEDGRLYSIPAPHEHQLMTSIDGGDQPVHIYDLSNSQYINQPAGLAAADAADVKLSGQTVSVSDVLAAASSVVDGTAKNER